MEIFCKIINVFSVTLLNKNKVFIYFFKKSF